MKHGLIAALALVGFAAATAHAQTNIEWLNPSDGLWSNAGNWADGNIPNIACGG